jgi:hypothetical protein
MIGLSISYVPFSFIIISVYSYEIWLQLIAFWLTAIANNFIVDYMDLRWSFGTLCFFYFIAQVIGYIVISKYLVELTDKTRAQVY